MRIVARHYRLVIIVLMTVVSCANQALAQVAEISGAVVENVENHPIEFSTVSVYNSIDSTLVTGVISDAKGKFTVKNLREGRYYAIVQFLGYEPKNISDVVLTRNQKLDLGVISLATQQRILNELIVTGEKMSTYHQIDKQIYTASQFQTSQGGNAIDVLRNLPSLTVNSEGEIAMRGTAGFIVLLDGKATQADPLVILNQLPANTIENIEVITTPSSKFDPDGKAGIINITTKKGLAEGYYVSANVQGGLPSVQDYGNEERPVRFGGDITASYNKGRFNYSLSANYKREDIAGYRDGEVETVVGNTFTTFPSHGERSYRSFSYGVKGVLNYAVNKSNLLEVGFYAGKKSQFRKANILYNQKRFDITNSKQINSLDYFNKNLRERKGDFFVSNIDYTHIFPKKGTISLSALYEKTILGGPTRNTDVNPEDQSQVYNDADIQEANPLDGLRLKSDFIQPVGKKGKFEAGYQYRYLLHKGDFVYNQLDTESGTWFIRNDLSNKVRLTRHIHSLYGQYSDQVGKLNYSAGLRLEYVDRTLDDQDNPDPYLFERTNLFPAVNLLYDLDGGYKLKTGYSRRISHTTSNMMNPFPARRHSEVLEVGDPNLLPEYIDVAEIGAVKDFGHNSVFANLYYRNTQNVINRVNTVYNDTILVRTFTNAGVGKAWGIETGFDLKVKEWWSFFIGANVYQYSIKGDVFNMAVNASSVNYSINANSTLEIQPSLLLQLTVNYTSRTVTAQGEDSRFLIPTLALKKTILKGQGNIGLQWQNIDLGMNESNRQRMTTQGDGFYTSTNYIQEVDIFRINFNYQFNKLAKKIKFTESEFGEKEF